jgi:hypothetical protein
MASVYDRRIKVGVADSRAQREILSAFGCALRAEVRRS